MRITHKIIVAILAAALWINASEFFRNKLVLRSFWMKHYQDMGLVFPETGVNGMLWGVWGIVFAVVIFILSRRFSLFQTSLIAWFSGFVMMWVVTFNLGSLPTRILPYAVPLSMLETVVAAFICKKVCAKPKEM